MKISDEQYEWLLNWYQNTAADELLKEVRQEDSVQKEFSYDYNPSLYSSSSSASPVSYTQREDQFYSPLTWIPYYAPSSLYLFAPIPRYSVVKASYCESHPDPPPA
ncbi:hypothetical protein GYMLUDRAFT_244223 [Collybiopsis luxurians FD-317 M1]|uniref:Uncharacterized protein n=1 Tax=Collybiopsis luxurians FD-317 M1 TaxID=944289 RepID=A0A0D0BAC4_9AGAR|nr:hypothetical protein GYMLUDRAFT_244223 [Collybiopsis luxurians FD-317 M1]